MFGLIRKSAITIACRPCCSSSLSSVSQRCASITAVQKRVISDAAGNVEENVGQKKADRRKSGTKRHVSQYHIEELLSKMYDCCRMPTRRAQCVQLLQESGDRLSERSLNLKHLAHHIHLSNHLGVADRWKIEFLVEEAVKAKDAHADGKMQLQLLSVVRLLLRAPVSRTPTALAIRDFGRSIGGFHGALLFVKMTRALLALQTARNRNDMITSADVEVMLSLARPYLGDYELNKDAVAVLSHNAWHDLKISSDDWSRLVQPAALSRVGEFTFEEVATSLVSLYRGYNDQSAIVAALKKKEKALIGRLFDLVIGTNDSETVMIADSIDAKFLTTLQAFLANSGQTALEALKAKWPLYEAENKHQDLRTLLSTLSLLHNVFGEKILEVNGAARWALKLMKRLTKTPWPENETFFLRIDTQVKAVGKLFPYIRNQWSDQSGANDAVLAVKSIFDQYTARELQAYIIEKGSKCFINESASEASPLLASPLLTAAFKQSLVERFCQASATFRRNDLQALNWNELIATLAMLAYNFKIFPSDMADRDFYADLWQDGELIKPNVLNHPNLLVELLRAASRAQAVKPTVLFWNKLITRLAQSNTLTDKHKLILLRCYNELGLTYPDYRLPRFILPQQHHQKRLADAVNSGDFCPINMLQTICGLRSVVLPADVLSILENLISIASGHYSSRRLTEGLAYLSNLGHRVSANFWTMFDNVSGDVPVESVVNSIMLQSVLGSNALPVELVTRSLAQLDVSSQKGALLMHQMYLLHSKDKMIFPARVSEAMTTTDWTAKIADYLAADAAKNSADMNEFLTLSSIFDAANIKMNCAIPEGGVVAKYVIRTGDGLLALDSVEKRRYLLDGSVVESIPSAALLVRKLLSSAGYKVASINDIIGTSR